MISTRLRLCMIKNVTISRIAAACLHQIFFDYTDLIVQTKYIHHTFPPSSY